jgi:hypothetical protein
MPAASALGADLLQFNTSVRGEGMGTSGVATHWGGDPGLWSNPALAVYQTGWRFTSMESQLLPGLVDDLWLRDERVTMGTDWFGVMFARGPLDGTRLDMSASGLMPGSDRVESWMRAEQMGIGVDAVRLLEALTGDSGFSRMFGLSAGYTHIDYSDELNVDEALNDISSEAEGTARSYGGLARFTPLNTVGPTHASGPLGGVRVSLAYGMSVINDSDEMLRKNDFFTGDPFPRRYLRGWSAHVETGFPPDLRRGFRNVGLGWVVDSLTPLISFGYTDEVSEPGVRFDTNRDGYYYTHDTSGDFDITSTGWELSVANIWSIRRGHYNGPDGLGGDTEGGSLGFKIDGIGGARWDKATVPQAAGLADIERESWTVWIDLAGLVD